MLNHQAHLSITHDKWCHCVKIEDTDSWDAILTLGDQAEGGRIFLCSRCCCCNIRQLVQPCRMHSTYPPADQTLCTDQVMYGKQFRTRPLTVGFAKSHLSFTTLQNNNCLINSRQSAAAITYAHRGHAAPPARQVVYKWHVSLVGRCVQYGVVYNWRETTLNTLRMLSQL